MEIPCCEKGLHREPHTCTVGHHTGLRDSGAKFSVTNCHLKLPHETHCEEYETSNMENVVRLPRGTTSTLRHCEPPLEMTLIWPVPPCSPHWASPVDIFPHMYSCTFSSNTLRGWESFDPPAEVRVSHQESPVRSDHSLMRLVGLVAGSLTIDLTRWIASLFYGGCLVTVQNSGKGPQEGPAFHGTPFVPLPSTLLG